MSKKAKLIKELKRAHGAIVGAWNALERAQDTADQIYEAHLNSGGGRYRPADVIHAEAGAWMRKLGAADKAVVYLLREARSLQEVGPSGRRRTSRR